jgi:hypothetical protein
MEAQTPEAPTEQRRTALLYSIAREQARRGAEGMWRTAWSICQAVNMGFQHGPQSAERLEWDMHHLWYTYYQASSTHIPLWTNNDPDVTLLTT